MEHGFSFPCSIRVSSVAQLSVVGGIFELTHSAASGERNTLVQEMHTVAARP
jgi:hypothetical protein